MALPAYSPSGGIGSLYTDPETGASYIFQGGTNWQQISSGAIKTPTAQAPAAKPVTTSQPSQDYMQYYAGWNPESASQDFQKAYGGDVNRLMQARGVSTGGGQSDLMGQIDQLYGSTNAIYDQYLSTQLPSELETAMGAITTQKTQSERQASTALEQAMADFAKQQEQTYQNQQASENTLLRQRNSAVQSGMAMYGAGSSTGGAIFEIINQEFLRNSGNVKVAAQNAFSAIFSEEAKARRFYDDYIKKLDEDVKIATKQANDEYNNRMLQIRMAKAQTEDAKTQAKIAVLQDLQSQAQNLYNWKLENVMALETWMAQQKDTLNNSTEYVAELAAKLANNQLFAQNQNVLSSTLQRQNIPTLGSSAYKSTTGKGNNPWEEIENPFV